MTLQEVYTLSVKWLEGDDTYTAYQIIDMTIDTLEKENVSILNPLFDLYTKLVYHKNWWSDNNLKEQNEEGDELIEDITGYLGNYLSH